MSLPEEKGVTVWILDRMSKFEESVNSRFDTIEDKFDSYSGKVDTMINETRAERDAREARKERLKSALKWAGGVAVGLLPIVVAAMVGK